MMKDKCLDGKNHKWKIEYGLPESDLLHIYTVDTYSCIKCGKKKIITHKEIK